MEITRENVMAIPLAELRTIADDYHGMGEIGIANMFHGMLDEIEALRTIKEPEATWYLDAADTECGYSEKCDIIGNYSPGDVVGIEHCAVLKTTYHATLPAADDADSDDPWEFESDDEDEVLAAVEAEKARRKALAQDDEAGLDDTPEHDCGVDVCVCADPA
jgi:hypothetical protein